MILEWNPPKGTPAPDNWSQFLSIVQNGNILIVPTGMVVLARAELGGNVVSHKEAIASGLL